MIQTYSKVLKEIRSELAQLFGNNSKRLQYERLVNLEIFIRRNLSQIYQKNAQVLRSALTEIYTETYYSSAWAIENEIQVNLFWGILNPVVVAEMIQAPIDKITLNDRLERNRARILSSLRSTISQGIIKGDSYEKISQKVKDLLEGDAKKARTVVRTEAHRVRNIAKIDNAKRASDLGIDTQKVWDATLDKRTRPAHQKLDGKKVGIEDNFVSINGGVGPSPGNLNNPKDDINCRCIMRLEIVGLEPSVRRIRGEGIVPYKTYEQWAKSKGYK